MAEGKYFFCRSKLNGFVLDIKGGKGEGSPVITWSKKPTNSDNQLWYEDHFTGTIRSKMPHGLAFTINNNNELVVESVKPEKVANQRWHIMGDEVRNRDDGTRVLDIAGANPEAGSKVGAWTKTGAANQKWEFDYVPARYFIILSQMNGKALDVSRSLRDPGTPVLMYAKYTPHADNQLWYEDKKGLIRTKLNDFVLDTSGEGGQLTIQPYYGSDDQMWVIHEDKIVHLKKPNRVLDILDNDKNDGARVAEWDFSNKPNQKWKFELDHPK